MLVDLDVDLSSLTTRDMMFTFVLLSSLLLSAAATDHLATTDSVEWRLFDSFMSNHSRSYRNDVNELKYRFQVFQV